MSTAARALGQESREELELLLAHADDQRPVLDSGLVPESVWSAPKPESPPGRAGVPSLDRRDGDPNCRWPTFCLIGIGPSASGK